MAHNESVEYVNESADVPDDVLKQWRCKAADQGSTRVHTATGPCPVCGAVASGMLKESYDIYGAEVTNGALDVSLAEFRRGAPKEIEIPVRCACGSKHGKDGMTSCGRRWTVTYLDNGS